MGTTNTLVFVSLQKEEKKHSGDLGVAFTLDLWERKQRSYDKTLGMVNLLNARLPSSSHCLSCQLYPFCPCEDDVIHSYTFSRQHAYVYDVVHHYTSSRHHAYVYKCSICFSYSNLSTFSVITSPML